MDEWCNGSSQAGDVVYDDAPAILVFSNAETSAQAAKDAVIAIGARVAGSYALDEIDARLEAQLGYDGIFVELDEHADSVIETLARNLGTLSARHAATIINAPLSLLDQVAARLDGRLVNLLCEPSAGDRIATLALSLRRDAMQFSDVATDSDTGQLAKLADEVARIAQALSRLSPREIEPAPSSRMSDVMIGYRADPIFPPAVVVDRSRAREIRNIIRQRRLRDQFFDSELFADPAWDMLLDLMAARIEGVEVAVSSLCIAAAVPPTTALRWIKTMTDAGLFERCADPGDGRRIFIRLADKTAAALDAYLDAAKKAGGAII